MEPFEKKQAITIKELKDVIKDLPEVDEETGEPYEVWINGTNCRYGLSNSCKGIWRLNKGDIILNIFGEHEPWD